MNNFKKKLQFLPCFFALNFISTQNYVNNHFLSKNFTYATSKTRQTKVT